MPQKTDAPEKMGGEGSCKFCKIAVALVYESRNIGRFKISAVVDFCLLFACFNERARGFPGKKVYAAMAGRLPYQLPSCRINWLISNSRRNSTLSHLIDLY